MISKCKICKNDTVNIKDIKTDKTYFKCTNCEYIFLDELSYVDENHERRHYDKHHNNLESLGYVKMFEDLVEEFITPYDDINYTLDFGCGEGEVLPIVLERNSIRCDRYDLFYFPKKIYEDKIYDLITSTEVIEHLENPLDIFKKLISHVRKDGYLVFMTGFHPSDDEKFFKWWYIRDITHIGFFNLKTFEYIAQVLDLKILKHNDKNTIMFQKN